MTDKQELEPEQEQEEILVVGQDSRNFALLLWIGTIFFSFIPSFIVYLIRTEYPFEKEHAKEALNWSITALIGYCAGGLLTILVIGALLLPVVWILNLVFSIMGAVAASKGQNYKTPFALRLIK